MAQELGQLNKKATQGGSGKKYPLKFIYFHYKCNNLDTKAQTL